MATRTGPHPHLTTAGSRCQYTNHGTGPVVLSPRAPSNRSADDAPTSYHRHPPGVKPLVAPLLGPTGRLGTPTVVMGAAGGVSGPVHPGDRGRDDRGVSQVIPTGRGCRPWLPAVAVGPSSRRTEERSDEGTRLTRVFLESQGMLIFY